MQRNLSLWRATQARYNQVMGSPRFNLEQLASVRRTQRISERLVAGHFRIPALPSWRYPYEVVTLTDLRRLERRAEALAHLVLYQRRRPAEMEQHYRICLQDDVILRRLSRRPLLESLLTYVLTHELVHVVRFQRAEQSFSAAKGRQDEETLVHQTALELVAGAGLPHVEQLDSLVG